MLSPAGTRPMAHDRYDDRSQVISSPTNFENHHTKEMLRKHSAEKRATLLKSVDVHNVPRQTLGTAKANREALLSQFVTTGKEKKNLKSTKKLKSERRDNMSTVLSTGYSRGGNNSHQRNPSSMTKARLSESKSKSTVRRGPKQSLPIKSENRRSRS